MQRDWEALEPEKPVNEKRVTTYRFLMRDAERISQARVQRGENRATINAALAQSELDDSEVADEPDLYLTTLTRFVVALGGAVEVRAVFPEETITVRSEPDDPPGRALA